VQEGFWQRLVGGGVGRRYERKVRIYIRGGWEIYRGKCGKYRDIWG
jgi:hypothetical protein